MVYFLTWCMLHLHCCDYLHCCHFLWWVYALIVSEAKKDLSESHILECMCRQSTCSWRHPNNSVFTVSPVMSCHETASPDVDGNIGITDCVLPSVSSHRVNATQVIFGGSCAAKLRNNIVMLSLALNVKVMNQQHSATVTPSSKALIKICRAFEPLEGYWSVLPGEHTVNIFTGIQRFKLLAYVVTVNIGAVETNWNLATVRLVFRCTSNICVVLFHRFQWLVCCVFRVLQWMYSALQRSCSTTSVFVAGLFHWQFPCH